MGLKHLRLTLIPSSAFICPAPYCALLCPAIYPQQLHFIVSIPKLPAGADANRSEIRPLVHYSSTAAAIAAAEDVSWQPRRSAGCCGAWRVLRTSLPVSAAVKASFFAPPLRASRPHRESSYSKLAPCQCPNALSWLSSHPISTYCLRTTDGHRRTGGGQAASGTGSKNDVHDAGWGSVSRFDNSWCRTPQLLAGAAQLASSFMAGSSAKPQGRKDRIAISLWFQWKQL